jgi:hypothetical protein
VGGLTLENMLMSEDLAEFDEAIYVIILRDLA